jgi:hypothetical protein
LRRKYHCVFHMMLTIIKDYFLKTVGYSLK